MNDLIEALKILSTLVDDPNMHSPTHCTHDQLWIDGDAERATPEQLSRLDELGFIPDEENGEGFISFRFGSC